MTTENNTAALKGLVLCGGHSTRMREDKSQIGYHGMPQWQYLVQLLQAHLPEVYLSCRADQAALYSSYPNVIVDSASGGGPAAGLLSAHALQPQTAWLVLACDLPLISHQSLELLIKERRPDKAATTFISPVNELPEPLVAIWEPAGLISLQKNVEEGRNCPRKTMLANDLHLLQNPVPMEQFNANTPEEKILGFKNLGIS
ncbi:NTP transferase domain-containing protein [Chitinophaga vietnamensis]|uniref:NTP transferase domain-containing protein n=1 Tax=Chitinophaga vietnamensis TaxID=2593957 RepID=UPI001177EDB2|nr:NTP transferase domain-containing protein [Chitinophaga vietnamensis]